MAMSNRRKLMVAATAVVAVVALLAWWAIGDERAKVHPARDGMSRVLARLAPCQPDGGVLPIAPDGSQAAGPARDSVELCGLGRFARKDLVEGGDGNAMLGRLAEDAMRLTVERLQAQPDERSRALAHLILWSTDGAAAARTYVERLVREEVDCDKVRCEPPPESDAALAAREALAQMAASTSDPWVYARTHQLCARQMVKGEAGGACQLISVERWAQIDPDNAVPWLLAASAAEQRKDAAGVAKAMYRASQARRSDARFGQSLAVAQAQLPQDVAPVIGLGIDTSLIGIESAFALPDYSMVTSYCAANSLSDPNRRAVCEGLATMLVERGTTMLDLTIGLHMGKRLDWLAERIAAIEELRNAISGTQAEFAAVEANSPAPLDCPAVEAQREQLRQVAAHGELDAYRRLADASPLGLSGLAAKHREAMMRMQRQFKAEEAASEAVSAPAN